MKTAVVMTTINFPKNLDIILKSISNDDIVVIATDRKTPKIINSDKRLIIFDIDKQISYCKNPIGVPFDCIQRRNMAYLFAIKEIIPDNIITIDDDNYPKNMYWAQEHKNNLGVIKENFSKKINVVNYCLKSCCDIHKDCGNIVHRGIPFEKINFDEPEITIEEKKVGINAGLWEGDPDINAYDRILHPSIKTKFINKNIITNPDNYHPFNSQNTIIDKFLFPTLFLIPMCSKSYGIVFGRYDDIWQSYICQRIMSKYNLYVRFGTPVVTQKRNSHNNITDIKEEFPGLIYTNNFINILKEIKLYENSPMSNMYEISDKLFRKNEKLSKYIAEKILWWLTELK